MPRGLFATLELMKRIILASQSPRRKELLERMGVKFETMPSDFYEELDDSRSPEKVAMELGLGKAKVIAHQHPDALVIGSDTIVTVNGHQLAKPESIEEARAMLRDHAQHPVKVTSSLAVLCEGQWFESVQAESAMVYFKPYNEWAAEDYLKTGDYKDKAGGFGIQSGAALLIDRVEGNPDLIVGLPTHLLAPVLKQFGYDVYPVVYEIPSEIKVITPNEEAPGLQL